MLIEFRYRRGLIFIEELVNLNLGILDAWGVILIGGSPLGYRARALSCRRASFAALRKSS